MSLEHNTRWQVLSEGIENTVLRPVSGVPNIVLKIPRPLNYLSMLGRDQAGVLRQELGEAKTLVEGTAIQIPSTVIRDGTERSILGLKTRSYLIRQQYVEEDGTVSDVEGHLSQQGLPTLVDEYKHEPRNFVSNSGVVYWIDPFKGTAGRVLEDTKIMKLETYRRVRKKLSKVIRLLGM